MRKDIRLETGWKFYKSEYGCTEMPDLTLPGWQSVNIPHDWAIGGPFSPENDPQPLESSVLDYHEGMIQIGRTGGLPIKGCGWYMLDQYFPEGYASYTLEFDGIMNHGAVYVNGHKAGERPYGYSSFSVNVTPYINAAENNRIVVRVNSMDKTSRWYPGAGIYRPVRLVMKEKNHVAYHGIHIRSECDVAGKTAHLDISCEIVGCGKVKHRIYDRTGILILETEGICAEAELKNIDLWDVENPNLYTLVTEVLEEKHVADRVSTPFGLRQAEFVKGKGFYLNGNRTEIKGVCLHHDFGMLGAAYQRSVARQRLSALKEMGCNAIRTTHNPPCPETLDLCDELGILVLEEAFDVWHTPKALNDYANEFEEWAERDLRDMIRRDRNHPSIFLYSIGNEIPDQVRAEGRDTCRWLVDICHEEDDTRLVTCGFNRPKAAVENGLTEEVDVVGLNYSPSFYREYHEKFPNWYLIATETCSSVSSRGEYYTPAEIEVPPVKHENLQVNSYDYSAAACAYIPDVEFEAQKTAPYVAGQFVWTGYDYLGEPTPYREEWPSRSSYFGIFDLAGMKKDRYYAYKANWSSEPVLHLFPHWNWEPGQLVDVHCYTNQAEAELYLNGRKLPEPQRQGHRLIWKNVVFEPGELKAVAYSQVGNTKEIICENHKITAGKPEQLMISWNPREIHPDGKEVIYAEVQVVDKYGVLCPNANNRITFQVSGAGNYLASDAGDATSTRIFSEPYCEAFHGKAVCAVAAGNQEGAILIEAMAEDLKPASLLVRVKR
ncbi:MAG: DUF4982 domain-containing protein [Clostridiales bacterium]|nr:DUF4982 domain-containing protein [Clostridiales bacterium]